MSIIIVNTESIAHYSIKEYRGMVTAHQVIGTNVFAEFLAGFTDVLGGTSGAYREKLELLCEDVRNQLSENAEAIGANAIIGYRIDFDEISGKGMSMFMVSCIGTAVVIEPDRYEIYEKLHNLNTYLKDGLLTQEQYEYEKNQIQNNSENFLANDVKLHAKKVEEERILKEKTQTALEKERKRRSLLSEEELRKEDVISSKSENIWMLSAEGIQKAKLPYTLKGKTMEEVIINLLADDMFNEAGKYYMEQTGADSESAYEYIYNLFFPEN
ncbi:Uncharacterized conserved protein YbjQ, UPF0145 family [Prevotella communis]|uniref:UPF0145 protein SAMN04487900_103168 n=1 Tax=Prevotella communis TaxID=2913614 RepID=A0A1H0EHA5_9BACT|nr:YbjQ family protein [Prevotella communis]SDN81847.1 Uncharacterized conserved protein YbjQ, UPF0145 family [Prevotella communis]